MSAAHLPIEKWLAIVLYNESLHFGVGINTIKDGSADTSSNILYNTTTEFGLLNRIIGLVHDTENANTGYSGGACVKFERIAKRECLRLMCR